MAMIKNDIGYFSAYMGIYPRTLYIVKGDNDKCIKDNFKARDDNELITDKFQETDGSRTWSVIEKGTGKFGFLVQLKNLDYYNDISHEAVHVAFETFRDIGGIADEDNQEPFAYLVGWATKQLYNALNYKKHKNK